MKFANARRWASRARRAKTSDVAISSGASILFHLSLLLLLVGWGMEPPGLERESRASLEIDTGLLPTPDFFEAEPAEELAKTAMRPLDDAADSGETAGASEEEPTDLLPPLAPLASRLPFDPPPAAARAGSGGGEGEPNQSGSAASAAPATEFFGVAAGGKRFLYVVDRSYSMSTNFALEAAKAELLASLGKLAPGMEFQIVFYNDEPQMLNQSAKLLPVSELAVARARAQIESAIPSGGTNHEKALRLAIEIRPDVIYVLTDAEDVSPKLVNQLSHLNRLSRGPKRAAVIHVIHFYESGKSKPDRTIRQLAEKNRGVYRMIDTRAFARGR